MAARKSCTHLTWAEAKGKVNPGGDAIKKKKGAPKKLTHVEKIIAKNGASQEAMAQEKSALRKMKRNEEKLAALSQKRAEERQQQRQVKVKPHEQARERMCELAAKQAAATASSECVVDGGVGTDMDMDMDLSDLKVIARCKEMQLDEIMALEAIFADTDEFMTAASSNLDELRQKIEEYQMDEENETLLRSVAQHPPISLLLQSTINNANKDLISGDDNLELVASLLLRATMPRTYPLSGSTPVFEIEYFMVTDLHMECNADKPLESLAHLEESTLKNAMQAEAKELLPDLSVYEVGVTWLTENLFEYISLSAHAVQSIAN